LLYVSSIQQRDKAATVYRYTCAIVDLMDIKICTLQWRWYVFKTIRKCLYPQASFWSIQTFWSIWKCFYLQESFWSV